MSGIRGQGRGPHCASQRRRNRIEIIPRDLLGAPYITPVSALSSNRSLSSVEAASVAQLWCRPSCLSCAGWHPLVLGSVHRASREAVTAG
jgi:hypothetical protein